MLRAGIEPARRLTPTDFLTYYGFRRLFEINSLGSGLYLHLFSRCNRDSQAGAVKSLHFFGAYIMKLRK